jgi:glutathione S-transferase
MVHYKLYYYPVRGRGDFIRYILHYADIPYEDVVMKIEDWRSTDKQKMPMGVIPVLELEDGRQLSQSTAIGRYLAKKHGLVSDDDFENAWGDQLVGAIEDIYPRYYGPYVRATLLDKSEEKQKAAWEEMKTNGLPPLFEKFESFLGDKVYFCGKKLHWADLVVAEFVDRIEQIFEKGFTQTKYPRLYAHCQRINELPQIKKYIEKRPKYFL